MRARCYYCVVSAIGQGCAVRPAIDGYRRVCDCRASCARRDYKMRRACLGSGALGEFEIPDPCAPVKAARGGIIFVSVIEGAVVDGINGKIRVIPPAIRSAALASGAIKKMLLTRQRV